MKMKICFTEASNVKNSEVVDDDKIEEIIFDWEDDVQVLDEPSNKKIVIKIENLSLFDHIIILNNVPYKPLYSFSRTSF